MIDFSSLDHVYETLHSSASFDTYQTSKINQCNWRTALYHCCFNLYFSHQHWTSSHILLMYHLWQDCSCLLFILSIYDFCHILVNRFLKCTCSIIIFQLNVCIYLLQVATCLFGFCLGSNWSLFYFAYIGMSLLTNKPSFYKSILLSSFIHFQFSFS